MRTRYSTAMALATTALVTSAFTGFSAHAQQPSTPCAVPVSSQATPKPTAAQADYRERLHTHATGDGVRVAIIDTGIARHNQLPHLEAGDDLVAPDDPDPHFDCDLHGTAVATVIGSQTSGIAPDATLISIRQSSAHYRTSEEEGAPTGTGSLRTLVDAINIALDRDADIINISLVSCLPPDDALRLNPQPLEQALARAERTGTVIIAASGNTTSGCQPGHVVFPAHSPTVLAVEALAHSHAAADYSIPIPPEATLPPLSAPGHVPLTLNPRGEGWIERADRAGQPTPFHGTSFAAPVVSATAALLKQRYPSMSAADIRDHIIAAADPSLGVVDPLRTVTFVGGETMETRAARVQPEEKPTPQAVRLSGLTAGGLAIAAIVGLIAVALTRRFNA